MTALNDDASLIAECRAGRTDAFGELVLRYQDRLYPTAFRLAGGEQDALDLLQETFLRAFRKLDGFQGESSFSTWVYRIMVNLALSGRRKRTPRLLGLIGRGGEPVDLAATPSDAPDPSAGLERSEREAIVQRCLGRLAPDHRAVVVMKEFDGLRYEEIAEALGVAVGTVRSRLHRARVELRDALAASGLADLSTPGGPAPPVVPGNGTRPATPLALTPPNLS